MTDTQVTAIEQLARTFDFGHGVRHSRKVATLAASLFDQFSFRGLIPALMTEDRRLLVAAALAHDLGASPRALASMTDSLQRQSVTDGSNHALLSCHVLHRALDDDYLPRLREITSSDLSALLYCILWHEGDPDACLHGIELDEPWRVRPLAGILRIAEGLDFAQRCIVTDIRVIVAPSRVRLIVKSVGPCNEEIARAQEKSDILSETLGLAVSVQQVIEEDARSQNAR